MIKNVLSAILGALLGVLGFIFFRGRGKGILDIGGGIDFARDVFDDSKKRASDIRKSVDDATGGVQQAGAAIDDALGIVDKIRNRGSSPGTDNGRH